MTATPPPTDTPAVTWENPERAEGPAPGIEYAPHGARLVAYILDGLIASAVCIILVVVALILLVAGSTVVDNKVTQMNPVTTTVFVLLLILTVLVALLYFPFFWARGGQTPGMRPFGLRVVRDRDGGSIGWGTAFLRLIGLWVAGAVFYLGYIWIFIDKRRRGWQDLIAGTIVVKQS
jgi:uncharacterized RDD family membrane protein YckC